MTNLIIKIMEVFKENDLNDVMDIDLRTHNGHCVEVSVRFRYDGIIHGVRWLFEDMFYDREHLEHIRVDVNYTLEKFLRDRGKRKVAVVPGIPLNASRALLGLLPIERCLDDEIR